MTSGNSALGRAVVVREVVTFADLSKMNLCRFVRTFVACSHARAMNGSRVRICTFEGGAPERRIVRRRRDGVFVFLFSKFFRFFRPTQIPP